MLCYCPLLVGFGESAHMMCRFHVSEGSNSHDGNGVDSTGDVSMSSGMILLIIMVMDMRMGYFLCNDAELPCLANVSFLLLLLCPFRIMIEAQRGMSSMS
jgi:hypothetical protein